MSTATITSVAQEERARFAETGKQRRYIPALDGLRGAAILAVFLSHYSGGHTSGNAAAHLLAEVMDTGWVGVDLFFVLSGFLITGILLDTAEDPHRIRNFYARRALRIFPVFYGVLTVFLLLTPVLHLHWRAQHLLYFFYLSNMNAVLINDVIPPGRGVDLVHFWSLAVEEQFYLVWPMVVWHVRDRKLCLRLAMMIMIMAVLLRVILTREGVDAEIIYQLLPTRVDTLISGGILALLVRSRHANLFATTSLFALSGVGLLLVFWADGNTLHQSALMSTLGYTLLALFFTCVVHRAQVESGWIGRACNNPALRFLGRYSYSLYVYHGVLLVFLVPWLASIQQQSHSMIIGGAIFIGFSLCISLAVAMLSFHFIEQPFLRQKRRFS